MEHATLTFKFGTSRAADSYGYNLVSLWVDGKKVSSCNGGGYDMKGTALGDWIMKQFPEELKKLPAHNGADNTGYYGLRFWDTEKKEYVSVYNPNCKVILDGGCGFSSIERVLVAIGYRLKWLNTASNSRNSPDVYYLERC